MVDKEKGVKNKTTLPSYTLLHRRLILPDGMKNGIDWVM